MPIPRRSFVKWASLAAAGNMMGLEPFGALNALAQTAPDYKALVCIFLFGGNDTNNVIIPYDAKGYANYASLRGPLALPQSALLQLGSLPQFALHPSLPELQSLFDAGSAAFVANVGTLTQPLTRAQFIAGSACPSALYSHPGQQEEWQNGTSSSFGATGWGGRISDAITGSFNGSASIPMNTTVAGNAVFSNGQQTFAVSIQPNEIDLATCREGTACAARQASLQHLLKLSSGVSLVTAEAGIGSGSFNSIQALTSAVADGTPLKTVFPNNPLAAQLQQIAQLIQVRSALGVRRQIFFCGLGGFDTHGGQLPVHASLLAQLSPAVAAFYQATEELGVQNQVTSFTMSDFSRTFQPNSSTGSDHAWGSHQLVVGGAVKGGNLYGTFPTLALAGPDDADIAGRWIPTTASIQYASTLAQWFGVPASQLATVFPNIGNFSTAGLGFV